MDEPCCGTGGGGVRVGRVRASLLGLSDPPPERDSSVASAAAAPPALVLVPEDSFSSEHYLCTSSCYHKVFGDGPRLSS